MPIPNWGRDTKEKRKTSNSWQNKTFSNVNSTQRTEPFTSNCYLIKPIANCINKLLKKNSPQISVLNIKIILFRKGCILTPSVHSQINKTCYFRK